MKKKLTSLLLLASLSIPTVSQAAMFSDKYYPLDRKKTQCCLEVDDLYKYKIIPEQVMWMDGFQGVYQTKEEMVDYLTKVYGGCEFRESELKQNPQNPKQDGIVYMIWGDQGFVDNRKKTLYDTLNSDSFIITKMSSDEKLYHTLDQALKSEQFQRLEKKSGRNKIFIQAMNMNGQNEGLYDNTGKLIVDSNNQKVE